MPIYSYDRYTSTGETSFAITFDYLSSTHIEVYLDSVKQTTGYTIDTGTNKVTFGSAPTSGVIVLIQRVTPKTKAGYQAQIADFANGSVLTETDLDNAALGLLYISQEAEDSGATNAISKDLADLVWDSESTRIKNVGAPTAALDAVTKQYVDSLSLYNDAVSVPQRWTLSGDGATTAFTLPSPTPASTDVEMYVVDIDGVVKKPTTDFTLSGTTLTFTVAPASGSSNVTVRNFGVARDIIASPIQPSSTSTVGVTVKGLASQTANLQDWTDSADAVKASVDKDGNLSTTGTMGVTGATTLSSSATVGTTLGVTGATTLSNTLGVTGATTLTGGVTGNLNLVAGALQYAGVDAMSIRQIVAHDLTPPTGYASGYREFDTNGGATIHYTGVDITITPKVTGSTILLLTGTNITWVHDGSTDFRHGTFYVQTGNTQTTIESVMDGTDLIRLTTGQNLYTNTNGAYGYTNPSSVKTYTSTTADVAIKFSVGVSNHEDCKAWFYWQDVSSHLIAIEIA